MPAVPKKTAGSSKAGGVQSYDVGDIVLGRLKGYPAWPSRIVDPDAVNSKVAKARPGKNPSVYCVQYFPAGDFSWLHARDIQPLPTHQIQAYLQEPHRKKEGDLKRAYETALNPSEWETAQASYAAEVAADEDQLEDDEEEEEGDEDEDGAQKSNKRKAPKSKGKVEKKKAKVEKSEPKPKSSKPAKKSSSAKQPESKSAPEQPAADEDPLASDPVCIKVKDWRHKLQRAFLSKSLPSAEDMDAQDEIFKAIEAYQDMTIDALQYSKIGKVMKKIVTLEGIPRNDELKITDRAKKLMDGWTNFIESQNDPNGTTANGNGNGEGDAAPTSSKAAAAAAKDEKPKSTKSAAPASSSKAKDAKNADEDVKAAEAKADGAAPAEANGEGKEEAEVPGAEAPATEA